MIFQYINPAAAINGLRIINFKCFFFLYSISRLHHSVPVEILMKEYAGSMSRADNRRRTDVIAGQHLNIPGIHTARYNE